MNLNLRKRAIAGNFIIKSGKTGFYKDTPENRKLGVVGMKYTKDDKDFYKDPEVKAYYDRIQAKLDEGKHRELLHSQKIQKEAEEKRIRKEIRNKKEKWESSDEYFSLLEHQEELKTYQQDTRDVLEEHMMQEEEVLVDADKAGFDDPADYEGYQDWMAQKKDYEKEIKSFQEDIDKIEKKLNRYN